MFLATMHTVQDRHESPVLVGIADTAAKKGPPLSGAGPESGCKNQCLIVAVLGKRCERHLEGPDLISNDANGLRSNLLCESLR